MDKKASKVRKKTLPKKPATFLTIDNTNLFGWLMSCFIVCGCMFFLGVLVGRNTAPVQFDVDRIEEKLSSLQVSVLKQKEAPDEEVPEPDISDIPTDIIDVAELPVVHEDIIDQLKDKGREPVIYEQYVPPVLTPKYPKTPPANQNAAPEKKMPAPKTERQAAASEPVTILTPDVRPVPEEISTPVVKPATTARKKETVTTEKTIQQSSETAVLGFAIQVASLKDPDKARLLMNKFKEKGYPAFCQSSEVNGATWHRVRIGPYPDRELADKDQTRLKAAGVDCLVISMN